MRLIPPAFAQETGIGTIQVPPGTDKIQAASGAEIGIIFLLSNLITLVTVVAGIWAAFNIVLAGFRYLASSGDTKAHQEVQRQISHSLIGILLIVLVYAIGGALGLFFFGDATLFIEPRIPTNR